MHNSTSSTRILLLIHLPWQGTDPSLGSFSEKLLKEEIQQHCTDGAPASCGGAASRSVAQLHQCLRWQGAPLTEAQGRVPYEKTSAPRSATAL